MAKEITFLFGRLNLIAYYEDKRTFVLSSLNTDKIINERDFDWGFFDIHEVTIENIEYVTGNLVKYKLILNEEIVDKSSRRTLNTPINDRVVAKSPFILHIKTGVIAYHPVSNNISHNQFKQLFAKLIEAANDYLLINAEIQSINEQEKILEAIHQFDRINRVVVYLHPSNPNFSDHWKHIDLKLRNLEAESFTGIYKSESGLNLEGNKDVMSEIYMAVDGYGKATVFGEKSGKQSSASTGDAPLKLSVPQIEKNKPVLTPIIQKFLDIWDRMTKNEP